MEIFIAIVSLVCSILTIILFFKVWGMCNNVSAIKKRLENSEILPSELIFLAETNDASFDKMLAKAIYNALRNVSRDFEYSDWEDGYKKRYKYWVELCSEQGWQFPEFFADKKTCKEFRDYFIK